MEISKYVIGVKYKFDRSSITEIDRAMRLLQKKINGFSKKVQKNLTLSVDKFDVDQRKLNFVLGNALDRASNSVVFQVSRFDVDQRALRAAMSRASRSLTIGAGIGGLSSREFDRRASLTSRLRREEDDLRHRNSLDLLRRRGSMGGGNAVFGGGVAGLSARFPILSPALALVGGGYGLSRTNQMNQQVVAAQLQTQATVQQFGGTVQQGKESFDWLRGQADRIGFNYLDASSDYNKLLSGLMGSGFSLQQGQNVFKGFAEVARVNKLDRVTQNRLFRALSQVAGKDQLMSEELTGQIARILAL